jgi:predicted ABC-type transport system involved in lysophospholipase L1 biosynthesis ATPase subunit
MAIRVVDVSKTYGPAANPVHALRGVTFEVQAEERVALLGKSGSGKSTLLSLLGGLDRPTGGHVWVHDRDLATFTDDERAGHRLTGVGIVFQAYHLIPSRTAQQNVELPLLFSGHSPRARRAEARAILEAVGLGERLHHRPPELSGGERQRVALARALVNRPAMLLADEPTGNLDSSTSTEIMVLIRDYLTRNGTTLMLVTHDEDLARAHTDRVLRLQDGRLI